MSTKLKTKSLSLSKQVRNGRCGTPPKLLMRYFQVCNEQAENLQREKARMVYLVGMNVLVETLCDDLIAKCWRGWCLDNIGTPLSMIEKLSVSAQEQKELVRIKKQVRLLSRYFL